MDTLQQANQQLKKANHKLEKDLGEAKQKLEPASKVEKSLTKDKGRLEAKVKRLKTEVLEAKNLRVAKFEESEAYKSSFTSTSAMFLA